MAKQHFDTVEQTQEPKELQLHSMDTQQQSTQGACQIQYYFRSIISSVLDGVHILELIDIDILNQTLGLGVDLSDAWEDLLQSDRAAQNLEIFLDQCAATSGIWRNPHMEVYLESHLRRVVRSYEQAQNPQRVMQPYRAENPGRCRGFIISILHNLDRCLEDDVEMKLGTLKRGQTLMDLIFCKESFKLLRVPNHQDVERQIQKIHGIWNGTVDSIFHQGRSYVLYYTKQAFVKSPSCLLRPIGGHRRRDLSHGRATTARARCSAMPMCTARS
ncbi:uncharacterized protein PG998_002948 [Apiospora kogelbergensis]|uniref:uncharacterized protein n=1 Tax=Apiospora kogelbergensis TaxID=1337665 RepID=UPI00312EBB72